jgi:hypothetical protein
VDEADGVVGGPENVAHLNKEASAGAVRGGYPAEAFAKGGDSDERRVAPSLVSERYNTRRWFVGPLPKVIAPT